jgi:hypothetical protein
MPCSPTTQRLPSESPSSKGAFQLVSAHSLCCIPTFVTRPPKMATDATLHYLLERLKTLLKTPSFEPDQTCKPKLAATPAVRPPKFRLTC